MRVWTLGLTVVALGGIVYYGDALGTSLPGLLYLNVAILLAGFSIYLRVKMIAQRKSSHPSVSLWLIYTRARIALFIAWQLALLGLFGIWISVASNVLMAFAMSNAAVVICIIGWDRLIAIADDHSQTGWVALFRIGGHPRSRRFCFWACCVYPLSSLIFTELYLLSKPNTYPFFFHPPQLSLVIDAVCSAVAGGFIFQRYRHIAAGELRKEIFVLVGLGVGVMTTVLQRVSGWTVFTMVLSNWILLCVTWSAYWISRVSKSSTPVEA